MQAKLGVTGKAIITTLAVASIFVILFFTMLASETERERERVQDPVNLIFLAVFLAFSISLWRFAYKRWQAISVFVVIWAVLYGCNIILNLIY